MSVPWSALLYSGRATPPVAVHRLAAPLGRRLMARHDLPTLALRSGHLALAVALVLLASLRFGASSASVTQADQAAVADRASAAVTAQAIARGGEGYVGPVARTWTSRGIRAVLPAPSADLGQRLVTVGYVVQEGDSLASIAARFGLQPQSLLGANPTLSGGAEALRAGEELLILPVDGVYHEVTAGETLERIAARYGVTADVIRDYPGNSIREETILMAGEGLVIPGGVAPPREAASSAGSLPFLPDAWVPAEGTGGSGALQWPITGVLTQRYSAYHQAIDIATNAGTPVLAADAGYVASVGPYHAQYGNMIVINHGDGRQTLYAHLQSYAVETGQVVEAQQVIAYCGSTGNSTGPHLHFEVYENGVRQNPLHYLP